MSIADRVRVHSVKILSDDHYVLRKASFDYRRNDGTWQRQNRESYDRGNGAAILLYDSERRTVVLVRQFRYPAFASGHDDLLVEVPAGLLDDAAPEDRIRAEAEEETGFRVTEVTPVFQAFTSPGAVTEVLHCFIGRYRPADRAGAGGGHAEEGEDIEILEPSIEEALAMLRDGGIRDAKTIMLLQYAALHLFPGAVAG
jgi:nudix-type nucleoside diphosphatase (YffH/AdpP family)